jgi:hypothetical protein
MSTLTGLPRLPVMASALGNSRDEGGAAAPARSSSFRLAALARKSGAGTLNGVLQDAPHTTLRVNPDAAAGGWWAAVRRRPDVPPAISDLLTGRRRVELTPSEAAQVMTWAGSVEGWDAAVPKPLFIHGSS